MKEQGEAFLRVDFNCYLFIFYGNYLGGGKLLAGRRGRDALRCSGMLWDALGCFEILWDALGCQWSLAVPLRLGAVI